MNDPKLKIIIPTYNAMNHFKGLSQGLDFQEGISKADIVVIDSSSKDKTAEAFREWGAEVIVIDQKDFDHGGTRRMATERFPDSEFYVFLTQDAIPAKPDTIKNILSAFADEKVGMAYGCQLPRIEARGIERHARALNYPEDKIETRELADKEKYKIKTVFCSDSFAAYRKTALNEVDGMPKEAFFAEDQIVASKMLLQGWKLSYRGDAKVTHSHGYSIKEDFQRYFDVGVFHSRNTWILENFGKAEGEGINFVKSELSHLLKNDPTQLPSCIVRVFAKYLGYRLGMLERKLSNSTKQKLSMSSYYWAAKANAK